MTELPWNPHSPGQKVRMRNNPGEQGKTTGKVKESAGRLLVEVDFGPNEKKLRKFEQLELVEHIEDFRSLLSKGAYSDLYELRRIMIYEKVKGQLTNILYSMESSNTDFYPHQFRPVLKFLDSPVGRILIADEVGLGKTIEAIFIWKELQARQNARRLLIICPAMLKDKWKADLSTRFNIEAEFTNTKGLVERVRGLLKNDTSKNSTAFAYIASLEGLRPSKNWDDPEKSDSRDELARLFEQNPSTDEFSIFDLVIIDEAHYLRNRDTSNNQLGQLLRGASKHLVLLTATPIQISSSNLFQILQLISPEDFDNEYIFDQMLQINKPIVDALSLLCQTPLNLKEVYNLIDFAQRSSYFRDNQRLSFIHTEIAQKIENNSQPDVEYLVKWRQALESCSLLSQFMTRSRKRDVLENRVKRSPQALEIEFSSVEREVYNRISSQIRKLARGRKGVAFFSLIVRQRQMASCMVAALRAWKDQGLIDDLFSNNHHIITESLWEDFGLMTDSESVEEQWSFSNLGISDEEITQLKRNDSKYCKLIEFLHKQLSEDANEKFVLFAYFRGTLDYLKERLEEDGISTCILHGGIAFEKKDVLNTFKNTKISILLSSEIGSEGIDLQFCRFLINYDLPWNPMRVEQRIGRLDRLGQKADRISIIHYKISDTVEERILNKLYERINIFRESIGDLEDILGEETEHLVSDLLNPDLSEEEREQRAIQTLGAIANKKAEQEKLESEAINMVAFGDYILKKITQDREKGRWLRPEDIKFFIHDFFRLHYPETRITPKEDDLVEISLSSSAQIDLRLFCEGKHLSVSTKLYSVPVACFFDPKKVNSMRTRVELLDSTHPLIQWIRDEYDKKSKNSGTVHPFHGVSSIELNHKFVSCSSGVYVYIIHLWEFKGLRTETRLAFRAVHLESGDKLSDTIIEGILDKALSHGKSKPNAANLLNLDQVLEAYEQCKEELQFAFLENSDTFEQENTDRCNVQEQSVRTYFERRRSDLQQRIDRFRNENKLRIIPAIEGQLKKLEQDCEMHLKKIEQKRKCSVRNPELAAGLIFITH